MKLLITFLGIFGNKLVIFLTYLPYHFHYMLVFINNNEDICTFMLPFTVYGKEYYDYLKRFIRTGKITVILNKHQINDFGGYFFLSIKCL